MSCDVGEVTERLENGLCSFSNLSVISSTSQLILQSFCYFTYVTAHSPILPLLHLRYSSFSNHSFDSPTSVALHLLHLVSSPWKKVISKGSTILKVHKCCTYVDETMSEISTRYHYFSSNHCSRLIENVLFENVEKFKYLGVTVTNINDIHENIKLRINMGNACYYLLEKILSSLLKVNTYKTIILPVIFCGCETWSLTLREEHMLRVFEIENLGRYFGLREMKLQENGESYIMLSYMYCILRLTQLGILNRGY